MPTPIPSQPHPPSNSASYYYNLNYALPFEKVQQIAMWRIEVDRYRGGMPVIDLTEEEEEEEEGKGEDYFKRKEGLDVDVDADGEPDDRRYLYSEYTFDPRPRTALRRMNYDGVGMDLEREMEMAMGMDMDVEMYDEAAGMGVDQADDDFDWDRLTYVAEGDKRVFELPHPDVNPLVSNNLPIQIRVLFPNAFWRFEYSCFTTKRNVLTEFLSSVVPCSFPVASFVPDSVFRHPETHPHHLSVSPSQMCTDKDLIEKEYVRVIIQWNHFEEEKYLASKVLRKLPPPSPDHKASQWNNAVDHKAQWHNADRAVKFCANATRYIELHARRHRLPIDFEALFFKWYRPPAVYLYLPDETCQWDPETMYIFEQVETVLLGNLAASGEPLPEWSYYTPPPMQAEYVQV
ncbi:hypothetical protein CC1G_03513 [Coprinopsis cinerea okayama7|uniref:Uncharacterized protein n=1 Tax=Coprinopsis cinerea (strain Okayama-7 / 130 / ATCC MYA-4618 / FGSC 9003) TaxID=240176 RepID=A8NCF5_COPC7|nr:hypothetical protein CC1G_03513 [Coprinopsis cinerea okayama7\|eukprot:XP_001832499.2 hypothetical protein CC1G_03513 [Coprinopsis cinerea okayama7\